jgi:osmotically-inducible protein OsmY
MEAFMNPYKAVAALIAAGVSSVALALPSGQAPTWRAESEYKIADAPVASALNANSEDDIVKGVIDALNQDASLKGSKITVSSDQGIVSLTGVTNSEQQANKAVQIASSKVGGENNVVNVIQSAKMTYQTQQMRENERKIEQAESMEQG